MTWAKLIFSVVSELWESWRSRKPAEPSVSQRDIAIGVAAGETARQEGKRAPKLTRELEDTWPGK